jgi:omega-amidase
LENPSDLEFNPCLLFSPTECWNSPYATSSFPVYAEPIPEDASLVDKSQSPSLHMMLEAAKTSGVYLIGGSIPERSGSQVYNTCVIVGPGKSLQAPI